MAGAPEPKRFCAAAQAKQTPEVVVLEYSRLVDGSDLAAQVKEAFGPEGVGILYVRGVPGLREAREALLPLARRLALLPEEALKKYEREKAFYCIGWSRGREKFKGKPDLAKGSFYANPLYDDPSLGDAVVAERFPFARQNAWPSEVPELEEAFKRLGRLTYEVAKPLVRQVDRLVADARPDTPPACMTGRSRSLGS